MYRALVVDDEIEMLRSLEKILSHRKDFELVSTSDPLKAKEKLKEQKFDILITDLKMTSMTGIELLEFAKKINKNLIVIMISGYGTIEAGIEAVKKGAFDFIEKPFTSVKLFDCINRAVKEIVSDKKDKEAMVKSLEGIIYESNKMSDLIELVKKIAEGNMNLLITGESGTGKELIARAIHNLSKGNLEPFVPVNCGALPEHLFESELFGYEMGAFTGAVRSKPGLLEFANHGTFFFDEIGDMSLALQVKLLRMLEEKKIRRVGGKKEISIDVRIISATNQNLENAVRENRFRKDLYYRLNTIHLEVPALRERKEDVLPLANYLMAAICKREDQPVKEFSDEAKQVLIEYAWPGNVRELQNLIERAFYLNSEKIIGVSDLPLPDLRAPTQIDSKILELPYKQARDCLLEKFEIDYLTLHLKKHQGNISRAAEECGIDRRTIHRLINKYNIIYKE